MTKETEAIHFVIDSTVGDYFSSNEEITDLIYSPQVLDLSLKISDNLAQAHRKGYLMMGIVPQNTGTSVLIKNKTPVDWVSDQKPYIRQVFVQISALLNKNIAMTDLKPDNTLYDIDNKRAFIIDLGGSLKIEEGVEKCIMKKHDFQFTSYYTAPEVSSKVPIVDLKKALSYSCGKILEQIVKANNPNEDLIRISEQMMNPDPIARMSIEDGLQEILKIGDDKEKNAHLSEQYIRKIKFRLENNRSSISINEDIHDIRELLIPAHVIQSDPDVDRDEIPINLQEKIDDFLQGDVSDSNLFLLLGNAGSGKSILLQIEFVKAVYAWDPSKPIPIYFNLANGVNLKNVIRSLDSELGINLFDFIFDKTVEKNLNLFIDSFDEGIYQNETERENLIRQYSEMLCSKNVKYFISCRTDFLNKFESHDEWYILDSTQNSKKIKNKYYIVPLTYRGNTNNLENKENSLIKSLVKSYIENLSKIKNITNNWERYYEFIQRAKLENEITTGLIFHMIMKCYLYYDKDISNPIDGEEFKIIKSKVDIYRKFVFLMIENNLRNNYPLNQIQQTCIMKENSGHEFEEKMKAFLLEVGIYIAKSLHIKGEFRLKKDDKLFEFLGYIDDKNIDFRNQRICFVLRNLPLKIEIKKGKNGEQELAIGFIHDTIKNYFLLEGIKQETKIPLQDYSSKILGARNIVKDHELITFLRDGLLEDSESNESLTNYFLKQIYNTRERKNEEDVNVVYFT